MTTHDPEALLAHQAWVRRLALNLARDASEADDLVQETWLAALRERAVVGDLGAWLATVLKNSARVRAGVRAMDEQTLQLVTQGPYAAGGAELELVLPRAGLWPRFSGRVLDLDGHPVAGASLSVGTVGLALDRGSYSTYRGETRGEEALTDAEGLFELTDVPFSALVAVTGDHIERTEFGAPRAGGLERAIDGAPTDVTIVVRPRYHLRIDASDSPELADSAVVLDASGTILWCERIEGSSYYGRQEIELVAGRSGSWNLPPEAHTLVFRRQGVEVRRQQLFLQPRIENVLVP